MQREFVITLAHCCTQYKIDKEFVISLSDYGIITIMQEDDEDYIAHEELAALEKSIHFRDLGINMEGIDTIFHLLSKIEKLQEELTELKRNL